MSKKIISYFIIYSLVLLVVPFASIQNNGPFTNINILDNQSENVAEANYIEKDTLLTAEINLKPFVSQLKNELQQHDNDLLQLKNKYPTIIEVEKKFTYLNNFPFTKAHFDTEKDFSIEAIDENKVSIAVPIASNQVTNVYALDIKTDYFSQIEKKQQLRMYTVTYLNNDKWKTNPTKYKRKRKLSLDFQATLPDLKPDLNEKGISHYIEHELLIKYKDKIDENHLSQLLKKYQLEVVRQNDTAVVVKCLRKSTKNMIEELENDEINIQGSPIKYIEPHFIYLSNKLPNKASSNSLIPNDTLYHDYQWNLPMIQINQAWNLSRGNKNIIIAVVDTGIDLDHSEFKGKLVEGINILDTSKAPVDDDGHGTHVAGIISANTNNNEGIAGITWYNKIMPIKVLDQSGAGTLFDVAEGIIWATDHGAKIINLSLGNYAESKYLEDAVKYAYNNDVVLIAATGNDNTDELGYPAAYNEVMAVSAIDYYQERAEFANYGHYVDVVAPGVNIPSTYPNEQYAALSGTSMAAPHVSGLAGLIRSYNPKLTNKDIYNIIKNSANDLGKKGKDLYYGYGEINVIQALENIEQAQTPSIFYNWLKKIMNIKK